MLSFKLSLRNSKIILEGVDVRFSVDRRFVRYAQLFAHLFHLVLERGLICAHDSILLLQLVAQLLQSSVVLILALLFFLSFSRMVRKPRLE